MLGGCALASDLWRGAWCGSSGPRRWGRAGPLAPLGRGPRPGPAAASLPLAGAWVALWAAPLVLWPEWCLVPGGALGRCRLRGVCGVLRVATAPVGALGGSVGGPSGPLAWGCLDPGGPWAVARRVRAPSPVGPASGPPPPAAALFGPVVAPLGTVCAVCCVAAPSGRGAVDPSAVRSVAPVVVAPLGPVCVVGRVAAPSLRGSLSRVGNVALWGPPLVLVPGGVGLGSRLLRVPPPALPWLCGVSLGRPSSRRGGPFLGAFASPPPPGLARGSCPAALPGSGALCQRGGAFFGPGSHAAALPWLHKAKVASGGLAGDGYFRVFSGWPLTGDNTHGIVMVLRHQHGALTMRKP